MKKIWILAEDVQDHVTFSSGKQPFAALVSLSIKGEIQYTGVDAPCFRAWLLPKASSATGVQGGGYRVCSFLVSTWD